MPDEAEREGRHDIGENTEEEAHHFRFPFFLSGFAFVAFRRQGSHEVESHLEPRA